MLFTSRSRSPSTFVAAAAAAAAVFLTLPALTSADGFMFVPEPWITIDSSGASATVTPTMSTTKGSTSIVSAPPSELTQTSVYTLSIGGQATPTTGISPAPTAKGPGAAGAVFSCLEYKGIDSPFCVPRRGSLLAPGKTYYVTWYTDYFSTPNQTVQVQGRYIGGLFGWTSPMLPASQGFYAWNVNSSILTDHKASSLNVSLFLAAVNATGGIVETPLPGPIVVVTNEATNVSTGPNVSALAVAVPVVIGVVALGLLGFCVWSWRRHGRVPLLGGLFSSKRLSGQGYGVRQSHSQRVATGRGGGGGGTTKAAGAGIQLTPSDSWSPTKGRNVFREEIARQDRNYP